MPVTNTFEVSVFQLVKQIPIVTVIDYYNLLELKKRGSRLVACCPFHEERYPSLTVFPNTNSWKCFGCGEGGDATDLVAKSYSLKPYNAAKLIARDFGLCSSSIPLETKKKIAQLNQKREAKKKFRQRVDIAHRELSLLVRTTNRVLVAGGWESYQQLEHLVHRLPYWEHLLECLHHKEYGVQAYAVNEFEKHFSLGC